MMMRRGALRPLGRMLAGLWLLLLIPAVGLAQPQVKAFTSGQGMRVLLVESHGLPMVQAALLAAAGSGYLPPGKAGLAQLTADMLLEGAGELDAHAFTERLAFYGIGMGSEAGRDGIAISFTTLTSHLEETFARLADVLQRPRFAGEDFQRVVDARTASLKKQQEDPGTRAIRALYRSLYGAHPYAMPVEGTLETVPTLTLDDVRAFHRAMLHAPGMVLAVAGDVTEAQLAALVERHLGALDPTPSPLPPIPAMPDTAAGARLHLEMAQPQTTLRLGVLGVHRKEPDYYALLVMNHILGGGGFTSRLTEEIREKRGLAYGVYSYLAPKKGRGPLVVGMKTKVASTAEALALLQAEIRRMAEEGVTAHELEEAKRYLTGSFPLWLDTLGKLVDHLAVMGFHDLGLDYLARWPERIRAVTREEIQAAARRLLELKRFHVVTVGPAAEAATP